MSEKKKSGNFLKIILGRPSKQTSSLQDSQSGSSSPKDASSKTCKGGKVERRESTRLQNAAKLLRNLSKSKDVRQIQDDEDKDEGPPPPLPDRKNPVYQSEGKGRRREGKASSKPDRDSSKYTK
ncbi:uncharacterized protein LOC111708108 [Eurytemora carolleeae]|uniref:uncharacterized protein LOC111708108 n=1 Tax=Eurytemora carolleeae TaxID=1294199 RepID=UPI000C78E70C|nr:uncharacterized protein LOC111708108 [Eurytemora carolleeae]|eukprot:XP_023337142.1 uncharacterized protein LOC111708108 [Eurytemora affinis]